jgi:hypothetical protein
MQPGQLREALMRLVQALADFDHSASGDILTQLSGLAVNGDVAGTVRRVRERVDEYEYDQAAAMVRDLLQKLETA